MQDGLSVSLTGQVAMEERLTSLANNVANSRTVGFRATQITFDEVLKSVDDERVSMVSKGDEIISSRAGGLESTGNALDLAISGDAWFQVQVDGANVMTRDGRFKIDNQGALVTLNGDAVLDAGGAPIQLNAAGGSVDIAGDGVITQGGNVVGGVGLFSFNPGTNFERYGPSGFRANETTEVLVDQTKAGVMQGYIEQSNVNPVQEITRLITVQRGFEQSVALTEKADQSLQQLIQSFGR
ncbi:flagellar basal-body rod protein FlgF [Ahrensia kielensis]|uniref:flagellar basal-body rod protein FlgF n=1 Tax=Ahrensia kielensis TaxID=76980 RepID=UPI000378EF99|nr:flagellar basal-body rod protein FlgF [Ahrensia kielensis]